MTSDCVRRRWAATRRYVTPLDRLRWDGKSLPDVLAGHTANLVRSSAAVVRVEDPVIHADREAEVIRVDDEGAQHG